MSASDSFARAPIEALHCVRCGGALSDTDDPHQMRCRYCGTGHLSTNDDVPAVAPSRYIGRHAARRVLLERLRQSGLRSPRIEGETLRWLPYWQVQGKLVGWQVYHHTVDSSRSANDPVGVVDRTRTKETRREEDLIARDVDVSFAACDARIFDLIGISDRLEHMELRPFGHDEAARLGEVVAVVMPRAAALRRARLVQATGLVPPRASGVRQRVSLVRARTRLVYYPVWSFRFSTDGEPGAASIDAVRGRILGGDAIVQARPRVGDWFAMTIAAGWAAGVLPPLGILLLAAWILERIRMSPFHPDTLRATVAWLGHELDPRPSRRIDLARDDR